MRAQEVPRQSLVWEPPCSQNLVLIGPNGILSRCLIGSVIWQSGQFWPIGGQKKYRGHFWESSSLPLRNEPPGVLLLRDVEDEEYQLDCYTGWRKRREKKRRDVYLKTGKAGRREEPSPP